MRPVFTLLARELRSALRERNLVVYTLLIPLLLYPMMMWVIITGATFVKGQTDGLKSRMAVVTSGDVDTEPVSEALRSNDKIELSEGSVSIEDAQAQIRGGDLDLVIALERPEGEAASLTSNLAFDLYYDGSKDRSTEARSRAEKELRKYRTEWIEREVQDHGVTAEVWRAFEIKRDNVASERDMGAFLLGLIVPTTMIVMIGIGTLYPAIDAIAGERERMTWETTLTLGVSRRAMVTAKYLYVATMGSIAGLLNLGGMAAATAMLMRSSMFSDAKMDISIPPIAIPVVVIGTVVVALLMAALFLTVVSFARTFKEGQSLTSPIFMVIFLPVLMADYPPQEVGLNIALVPLANMLLVFKQVISGVMRTDFIAVAFASSLVVVAVCLAVATWLLRNEQIVLGAFEGSPTQMLRQLFQRNR